MSKKLIQRLAGIALILIILASSFMAYNRKSQYSYNVPHLLGMENGETAVQLDGPRTTTTEGPFVENHGAPESLDVDLRTLPQVGPTEKRIMREMGQFPTAQQESNVEDGALQVEKPSINAPAPTKSFKGLDSNSWGAGWPPDTHGDVGPTHYVQAVNTSIGIFRKSDGARLAAFTFDNFFSANGGTGMCATNNNGDPIVLYDQVSGRWIISDFAWADILNGPYYQCIAVSKTGNPVSGGWWLYTFKAHDNWLNDYPKLGVWRDGIYMSANMFDCTSPGCGSASYKGVRVWALNRTNLINGTALKSVAFNLGSAYGSLLPANVRGTLPPAGTREYFLADATSNSMYMWKFKVNWGTPSSSTFTGPQTFSVAAFTYPNWSAAVPQKNTSQKVDTLGDRLMTWLQYSNVGGTQSLWVSRTVQIGGRTGIRWYEVRNMSATPSTFQQGTYAPNGAWRWMPSLAVDKQGNMAMVYSMSSGSLFPSIRYAGRLAGNALNTIGQGERVLINGTGSQTGINRWGDYASISVDPEDGCTFWMTTEYYDATGSNWQTRIGAFKYPGCN
ncbi:MAG: hypothetical protein HY867_00475 [Chloroflexi bacterium]|nr:hypothetical protein [Chloroflexota bacterium]